MIEISAFLKIIEVSPINLILLKCISSCEKGENNNDNKKTLVVISDSAYLAT